MTDSERLIALILQSTEDLENTDIELPDLSQSYQALGEAVCTCLRQMQEIVRFAAGMADGDLTVPVPARSNLMAGPVKDLYYKLQHLKWQANQIAKGDYSQHVDFMGDFADSFNSMTNGLKTRENTIREQSEEKLRLLEKENIQLERQMNRQSAHFTAYREYTESFQHFRTQYKQMMSDVYMLFSEGRYEEGRQRIAKINDMMGNEVAIRKDYSNNEHVNTALLEIAAFCQQHGVAFNAVAHIPDSFSLDATLTPANLAQWMDFFYLLLESSNAPGRSLSVRSVEKCGWLSIIMQYGFACETCPTVETGEYSKGLQGIRDGIEKYGAMFDIKCNDEQSELVFVVHLPKK